MKIFFHELQVALTMGGEFANDTKQVYRVPSGLTESNQPKQAHFIYVQLLLEINENLS